MNDQPWAPLPPPTSRLFEIVAALLLLVFLVGGYIVAEALRAWIWKAVWQ
jgi:hypothetical protein